MNYVVINGVKSTTINGLLIQSLPPITKPSIKTQIETIDGRDGDIVNKLGYQSYTKELSIGLHGNYKVDDVIDYFNSSGKITFSNEMDKYYLYDIVDQIDFERLVRFKTATVKIRVQPFKYSLVDTKITKNITYEQSMTVFNRGNYIAKPIITIHGMGNIDLSLNGYHVMAINLSGHQYIKIDVSEMNAYKGDVLLNRLVSGNYDDLVLKIGTNNLMWVGDVTKIEIENYSRWV